MKPVLSPLCFSLMLFGVMSTSELVADDPWPVRCAKVAERKTAANKGFIGTIEPARRSLVGAAVAGRVESVNVEPGDFVDDGGKLVQLRTTAAEIRLAAAEADLEVNRQQLAELVQGPREEELQRFEARVKGAEAVRTYATKRFDRLAALSQRGVTAQGDLDEALSAKLAAIQNHVAASAEYQQAKAGTRAEQLAQAKARVQKSEEGLNQIQDELDEHTIRAPFRGFVVKRAVERGEWLAVGDPIAEIVELDPAEVRLAIPEHYISKVAVGAQVRVDVDAIRGSYTTQRSSIQPSSTSGREGNTHPTDNDFGFESPSSRSGSPRSNRGITGTIFRVIPDADVRTRSFPVRVRIANPTIAGSPLLKPGMLAKVFLAVGGTESNLVVPKDALVLDRERTYVFVTQNDRAVTDVRRVEVRITAIQDAVIQIKPQDGNVISAGDNVVVEGNERLETGQQVRILDD